MSETLGSVSNELQVTGENALAEMELEIIQHDNQWGVLANGMFFPLNSTLVKPLLWEPTHPGAMLQGHVMDCVAVSAPPDSDQEQYFVWILADNRSDIGYGHYRAVYNYAALEDDLKANVGEFVVIMYMGNFPSKKKPGRVYRSFVVGAPVRVRQVPEGQESLEF